MKSTLLVLIVLVAVLLLGHRQQAELTELKQARYEQYLQAGDYYRTVIEQQAALDCAEQLLSRQQLQIDLLEGLMDGRVRIEITPVPTSEY